jgi:glutaminyl-tRNA synthetase
MYDFTHGLSDSIEGITHSICTLEFEDHRPLYDWFLDELKVFHPQQIEFARLNLTYTIMSKRNLLELVELGFVAGWDDPRMPTIVGLRRRGFTPESIRNFCNRIGVAKRDSTVGVALLEHSLREDLNKSAPRVMCVLHPLRVVIDNYPEGQMEELEAINNPEDPDMGKRKVPFSRILYIEKNDFREDPPKKFYRLTPGREVRLRYAYFIKCVSVIKDEQTGEITELHCTYDPQTKGGDAPDGRKVKATLHWVSVEHSLNAEVRLYNHLFTKENPADNKNGADFKDFLNPNSLEILKSCRVEPSLANAAPGDHYQFERLGYFSVDNVDSTQEALVFNRSVSLRDTWAKIEKAQKKDSKTGKTDKKDQEPKANNIEGKKNKDVVKSPEEISIDYFSKIDLKVAVIKEAGLVDGSDKLIRVMADLGEGRLRQIFAGIRSAYPDPGKLIGKNVIVVANLKPLKMKFGISEGMILSGGQTGNLSVTTFDGEPLPGDKVS